MISESILLSATYAFSIFFAYLVYNYWRNYTFWVNSGLPYISFPRDSVIYPAHKAVTLTKFYKDLAPHPVGGLHIMSRPFLMIRDPALIRKILMKDFSYFADRGIEVNENVDPLHPHLFNIGGSRWRILRQKISPVFTSGKLKTMWPYMTECKDALEKYLDYLIETKGQFDVKEVMEKFATDVIGTCGFGLKCDAIQDEDSEYRRVLKTIMHDSNYFALRSLLRSMNLNLIRILRLKRFGAEVDRLFFSLMRELARLREETADERKDIVQHLINLQHEERENLKKLNDHSEPLMTDSIVAAQAMALFLAGFETTSATLAYCLYELALHPEILDKTKEEVMAVLQKHDGIVSYSCLKDMTYLQCVVEEAMRKYPALGWLDRICLEDYELPELSYTIKKNTRVLIPVHALHHDPQYFPDPQKFEPDRFSAENKQNIVPGTYMPFGDGPRMCIGFRFALMQIKTSLAFMVTKYDLEPTEKTEIPLKFKRRMRLSVPRGGVWLKFKKRKYEA